jgi:hypothetical protein
MASTYVNDLRLNEMATGDASGSWGTVTNTNLELIGEAFSYGTETIGDADSTLTIADGAADAARSFYLKITSSVDLTTTRIVTLAPNTVSKVWMIENATTGSQVITIKQGSGATINVPNGQVKMLATDGAGSGGAVLDLLVDVDLTGTTTLVNLDVSGTVDIAGDLTLSAGGDGALRFTAASSVKVLDNNAAALVFEEADNAYMTFVTTDGSEAVKFDKPLDINAALDIDSNIQLDGTFTVGVDDTGYDVKFFGATAGAYMLWDESADDLILGGAGGLVVAGNVDFNGDLDVDGTTNLDVVDIDGATQIDATVTVGVDDTGYDVKFFGATAGAYMLWDESADDLILGGAAGLSVNSTALVTGVLTTTAATVSNGGGQFNGAINVGVDDTGYDVKFFGATTGKSLLWDESADSLTVAGNLSVDGGTIKLDGNYPVGLYNVALGDNAGAAITTGGDNNVFVGADAAPVNTTGNNQVYVGRGAGYVNTSGTSNSGIGWAALVGNTTGGYNTALGAQALYSNTTAPNNTAVGYQAGYSNTTGTTIDAFGYQSLYSNTTGNANVGIGRSALYSNTTGGGNTGIGYTALSDSSTGNYNTALGMEALRLNTTASNNTAVGYQAGYTNTTGTENVAVGRYALLNATTASYNTATGTNALQINTTGANNVAVGSSALGSNTTASNNTAVGYKAGYSITTSELGVYIGSNTGESVTTGSRNTMVGVNAGASTTTGTGNTFIGGASTGAGNGAGKAITTGSKNTILGTYDGNQGDLDIRTSSNQIVLSDGDGNPRLHINSGGVTQLGSVDSFAGDTLVVTGKSVSSISYAMAVRGSDTSNNAMRIFHSASQVGGITFTNSATSFVTSSDHRLKENVVYDWDATTRLKQLKPARFNFIVDADTTVDGFLAHEAQEIVPECVTGTKDAVDADGVAVMQGIDQSKLVPLLVKTIQELEARITALENL